MQPILEYLPGTAGESFVTKLFDYQYYPTPWHFHPEYELVLVTESTGKRIVGDEISDFKPGDLALLGPYLPHIYRNDQEYYQNNTQLRAKSIVVHFRAESFGEGFAMLPEAQKINALLTRSVRGLAVTGNTNQIVSDKLNELLQTRGLARWMLLLDILNVLAESKNLEYICKRGIAGRNDTETHRMNTILQFVVKNFNREITIAEVAGLIGMTENSFSRYFSRRTRKKFIAFVNEVRLNHASKLLIETQQSVTWICMESGFNNLSNFNRLFRKAYQKNPLSFRKIYHGQLA